MNEACPKYNIPPRHFMRRPIRARVVRCRSSTTSLGHQTASPPLEFPTMSYYFAIIGTQDNPIFEYEFGTAKQGGDGVARFPEQARYMNQFIVHSSLDIVEEVQWGSGQMCVYLCHVLPISS